MDITGIGSVADLANTVINKLWPDKSEQEKAQIAMAVQVVQGQMDINKQEAASSSLFVAGWRPFIGWTCGSACWWNWIGISMVKTGAALVGYQIVLESADISEMLPILMGMLGLGGLRTFEKVKGVTR